MTIQRQELAMAPGEGKPPHHAAIRSEKPITAPVRNDWAYEAAATIYAMTFLDRNPTRVMDSIAEHLRVLQSEGNCMRMLTAMQRDLGVLP